MKRTNRVEINLNRSSQEYDLNKSTKGCAPCLAEASRIDRQINGRSMNEIKINEIKTIVRSIFEISKDDTK